MPDFYDHYETLYDAISAATSFTVVPVTGYEDDANRSVELPFVAYREETERGILGTYGAVEGSMNVLRSSWVISVFDRDLDPALTEASAIVNALVDADLTPSDGYTTTALHLIGFMPLFEKDGPNHAIHIRIMWERSGL